MRFSLAVLEARFYTGAKGASKLSIHAQKPYICAARQIRDIGHYGTIKI